MADINLNHLGLFEGIGGFSFAAQQVGFKTVAWCEIDKFCQTVLKYYHPEADELHDIIKTDFKPYANKIDIITGGFPCQPFSNAGKRKGTEDSRHLWPQMLRAITEIQPRWIVGENVGGLVNWSAGLVFEQVQTDLEAKGYEVFAFILPAAGINAPHRRDRVWFIAYNDSNGRNRSNSENEKQPNKAGKYAQHDIKPPIITNTSDAKPQRVKQYRSIKKKEPIQTNSGQFSSSICNTWQNFPTQSPVCGRNDGLPSQLFGITFSKWRNESLKGYGNAIVPQLAIEIFNTIIEYEQKYASNP